MAAIVDLSLDITDVAKAIRKAAIEEGFFYVINHEAFVGEERMRKMFEASHQLFELPLEKKEALSADINYRGYTAFREETLDPSMQKIGDTKEGKLQS